MKRSNPPPEEKKTLPIHWIKPTAFKIPIPRDEKQRLAALYRYDILDTPPERTFDSIAVLAYVGVRNFHVASDLPTVAAVWAMERRRRNVPSAKP